MESCVWLLLAENPNECIPLGIYSSLVIAGVELGLSLGCEVQWKSNGDSWLFLALDQAYTYCLLPMTVDQPPIKI